MNTVVVLIFVLFKRFKIVYELTVAFFYIVDTVTIADDVWKLKFDIFN